MNSFGWKWLRNTGIWKGFIGGDWANLVERQLLQRALLEAEEGTASGFQINNVWKQIWNPRWFLELVFSLNKVKKVFLWDLTVRELHWDEYSQNNVCWFYAQLCWEIFLKNNTQGNKLWLGFKMLINLVLSVHFLKKVNESVELMNFS